MIPLSLGFGLGVLAVVFADAVERRRRARLPRPIVLVLGSAFDQTPWRQRAKAAHDLIAQDSTIK